MWGNVLKRINSLYCSLSIKGNGSQLFHPVLYQKKKGGKSSTSSFISWSRGMYLCVHLKMSIVLQWWLPRIHCLSTFGREKLDWNHRAHWFPLWMSQKQFGCQINSGLTDSWIQNDISSLWCLMTSDWFGFVSFSKWNVSEAELLRVSSCLFSRRWGEADKHVWDQINLFCLKVAYEIKHKS